MLALVRKLLYNIRAWYDIRWSGRLLLQG